MAKMEANVDKMASLLSSHFGHYDDEAESHDDYAYEESQKCHQLPGHSQDGGGDTPQSWGQSASGE
jgi:hypothetical protein